MYRIMEEKEKGPRNRREHRVSRTGGRKKEAMAGKELWRNYGNWRAG